MDRHGSKSHAASSALQSVIASCALLGIVIAPLALAIAALWNRGFTRESLLVATIAGIVCWTSGATALSITAVSTRWGTPVQGVLLAMLFRMGLPLAALIAFSKADHPLAAAGLAPTTLGVYLAALVVETLLALRMVPTSTAIKTS
jgi:hypothetical protein